MAARCAAAAPEALFLSEDVADMNHGARFFEGLSEAVMREIRSAGRVVRLDCGETVFLQGQPHSGVWIIDSGLVRTFYVAQKGREMTLAYWTDGHFVGGPEVFGRGVHIWSADAQTPTTLLFLPGPALRELAARHTSVALGLIEGLVAKGKCYSMLVQMLATRSALERLEVLLKILAQRHGRPVEGGVLIDRRISQEKLSLMLGTSRQWLAVSLDRLRRDGIIAIQGKRVLLLKSRRISGCEHSRENMPTDNFQL